MIIVINKVLIFSNSGLASLFFCARGTESQRPSPTEIVKFKIPLFIEFPIWLNNLKFVKGNFFLNYSVNLGAGIAQSI